MNGEQMTELLIEHTAGITKNTADVRELFHRVQNLEHCTEENTETIAAVVAENREQFKRIEMVENIASDLKSMSENTHNIALSVRDIKSDIKHVGDRLSVIENEKRQKSLAGWQIVVSAGVGGFITAAIMQAFTHIFGG